MELKTHPEFRSAEVTVRDADTMDDYLGEALFHQHMFDKRTTPWEVKEWDYDFLQEFRIDLEKVDRLYHIWHMNDNVSNREFQFIARMDYEGKPLYVELIASCDYTGFECQGGGYIFISRDPSLFMKVVLSEGDHLNKKLIHQLLQEDMIYIEEIYYDRFSRMFWRNAPMLKYLCYEAIFQSRDKFRGNLNLLPKILRESIVDYIRTEEARIAYVDL